MTPPKKPEWMEIADNDGGSINPAPKAKKSRPMLIAAAALVLTFGGAVIAQSNQNSPAHAELSIAPQASQSATSAVSTSNNAVTPPPAIATPPKMKGGDDDEDVDEVQHRDRGDREHSEDDDEEFEEH